VVVKGRLQVRDEQDSAVILNHVTDLNTVTAKPKKLYIRFVKGMERTEEEILKVLDNYRGSTPVILYYEESKITKTAREDHFVQICDGLVSQLGRIVGEDNVKITGNS